MNSRRAVITGLGVASPIGLGVESFWQGLMEGRPGVRRIRAFDPSRFDSQIGGEIEGLDIRAYVPKSYRKSTKIMARDIEIAVAAAYLATKDADLKTRCLLERGEAGGEANVDPTRFGVNIGAGLICADLTELAGALYTSRTETGDFDIRKWGAEGMNNLTPLWLLKFLPNMLSCHVTIIHDAQAPSNTITCGEASSHLAIGEAFRTLERGVADVCLCGGAESKLNPMGLMRQSLLKRLCTCHNDAPAKACKPFDQNRCGTAISEGGGLLVLEDLEHALARGARIYCEVAGFGAGVDPRSWHQPDPTGESIALAARKAIADAGMMAADIDCVVAFGLGTIEHDAAEARGIRTVLGERAGRIPTLAIKGSIGNNGAGAGGIEVAAGALCLKNQTVPASISTETVDPACGLNVVTGRPITGRFNAVLTTAYALGGGQTAALVLKRWEA